MEITRDMMSIIISFISLGGVIGSIFTFKSKTEIVQRYTDERLTDLENKLSINTNKLDEKINNSLLRIEKTLNDKLEIVNKALDSQNNKIHEFDKLSSVVVNNVESLAKQLLSINEGYKETIKYLHDIDIKLNNVISKQK